jgi:tetratricopeptide (TPR) repeat protein
MLAKEDNNCVSCHMQLSGAIDIPHVGVHDHKISIPVKEVNKEAIKKFVGINAINNPNPPREAIAQAYINYFEKFGMGKEMLDSALKYIPVNSADDKTKSLPKVVQVFFLKKDYPSVIRYVESVPNAQALLNKKQYDNYYAWTCYRIGESYSQLGNPSAAMKWYAQANQLAPLSAEFANKYGNVLASSGNIKEAKRIFLASVNEHPEYAPAYSNLGYLILSSEGNIPKALELYTKALALDPDYEQGLLNMAGVLAVQKNFDEATKYLKRVLKKNPDNAQAKAAMIQLSKMK